MSQARADNGDFAASWAPIGRDAETVDPGDALRVDQEPAQTQPARSSDPRFLPTALEDLDETVVATIRAVNASRAGLPNPGART